ncbi:MAG: ABC transporter permease [Planctomycetota bacterium]
MIAVTQTWTLLVDAYRELNARKLFWITLFLSGLLVIVFALLGITDQGVTFGPFTMPLPLSLGFFGGEENGERNFYALMFSNFGVNIWLTWIAAILALISTAGIVPDLIQGGAIDTVLSKPIGRVRLLLTKYFLGLLFVTLQVSVFTFGCFFVFGFRANVWEPQLLLAIPIVVTFFSYLYGVCALLGLLTRSTIASLLVTLLFWFVLFLVNSADVILLQFRTQSELTEQRLVERIERIESNTERGIIGRVRREQGDEAADAYEVSDQELLETNPFLVRSREDLESTRADLYDPWGLVFWSDSITTLKTVLPKTTETTALLERTLVDLNELDFGDLPEDDNALPSDEVEGVSISAREVNIATEEALRDRSTWWIVGTSLLFEAAVLGLGCLIFWRRDF